MKSIEDHMQCRVNLQDTHTLYAHMYVLVSHYMIE